MSIDISLIGESAQFVAEAAETSQVGHGEIVRRALTLYRFYEIARQEDAVLLKRWPNGSVARVVVAWQQKPEVSGEPHTE